MAAGVYRLAGDPRRGIKAGDHHERGPDGEIRTYEHGDIVKSDRDLCAEHPGKFEIAPPGSVDKYEAMEAAGKKPAKHPTVGLPTRRTPRPAGPEETGNSRAEIEEVANAVEAGDHDVEQRADPNPPEEDDDDWTGGRKIEKPAKINKTARKGDLPKEKKKKVKVSSAPPEDDEDEDDDDLVDVDTDEEEEKPKKSKKKKKKVKVKVD